MNEEDIELPEDDLDEDVGLEQDPHEQAIQQLVQSQMQSQQQLSQAVQQISEMQARVAQALTQALDHVAQTNQMIAQAMQSLSAPRRRVAVRDGEGKITEAHDLPMGM